MWIKWGLRAKDQRIQELEKSLEEAKSQETLEELRKVLSLRPLEGWIGLIERIKNAHPNDLSGVHPCLQQLFNQALETVREQNCYTAHHHKVKAVAVSPDGQKIASSDFNGTLKVWNLQEPTTIYWQEQFLNSQRINALSYSPDGTHLLSGRESGQIQIWTKEGKLGKTWSHPHQDGINALAISPDGQKIASGGTEGLIYLWNFEGKLIDSPLEAHQDEITSLAWSPEGHTLLSGSADKTLKLWNLNAENQAEITTFTGHQERVSCVAITPDGQTFISGSWDKSIRLWNREGELLIPPLTGHEDYILAVTLSLDGKTIISGSSDATLRLWTLDGEVIGLPLYGHQGAVRTLAVSRDGKTIISGSSDHSVRLWHLQGNHLAHSKEKQNQGIWSTAVSRDGQTVISGGGDGSLQWWNNQGELLHSAQKEHQGAITTLALSEDGKRLISGGWDSQICCWNQQGQLLNKITLDSLTSVTALTFGQDGQSIISLTNDGRLRQWGLKGELLGTLLNFPKEMTSVAFDLAQKKIVGTDGEKKLELWTYEPKRRNFSVKSPQERIQAVAISPDGQIILSAGSDGSVCQWSLQGQLIQSLLSCHDNAINSIVFMADGQRFMTGASDGTIKLWDINGNLLNLPYSIGTSEVNSLAFSPDSQQIISGNLEGKMYWWWGGNWQVTLKESLRRLSGHSQLSSSHKKIAYPLFHPKSKKPKDLAITSASSVNSEIKIPFILGLSSLLLLFALLTKISPRMERVTWLCQLWPSCAKELELEKYYGQIVQDTEKILSKAHQTENLINWELSKTHLSQTIKKLEGIPSDRSFSAQVKQSLNHYRRELNYINAYIEKEEQAQQKFERAQETLRETRQRMNSARTLAQYQQLQTELKQVKWQLERISENRSLTQEITNKLRETQQSIQTVESQIRQITTQKSVSVAAQPPSRSRSAQVAPHSVKKSSSNSPKPASSPSPPPKMSAKPAPTPPSPTETASIQPPTPASIPGKIPPKKVIPHSHEEAAVINPHQSLFAPKSLSSHQISNDIAAGLLVAAQKKQISYGTQAYRKVQTAIIILRRGKTLEEAAQGSNVSLATLQELRDWGKKRSSFVPGSSLTETDRDQSIRTANEIATGLVVAADKRQINYATSTYRKVQTAISILRRGGTIEEAAQRSTVSLKTLQQLQKWGQSLRAPSPSSLNSQGR